MENKNPKDKQNSYKFSSSYLTRPFSSSDQRQNKNNNEIIEEIPDPDMIDKNNMTYFNNNNNQDFNYSVSNIQKNDESMTSNASMNFTKKELMSQFNNQTNNLNISSSTISSKKRKPFEKLSFHSDSQTYVSEKINNNNINDQTEDTKSITNINNIMDDKPINISDNNLNDISNISQSNMNKSQISFDEKSMILSNYKSLSKETLEKAKKFNSNYKNSTPFWIKFFEDIQNDTLSANSSYFKYDNKNEYIKSLIEMVQRDADIYDEINKNKKKKEETQNSIKKLLDESKKVQEDIKNKSTASNKNINNTQTQEEKSQIELDNKLNQVLNIYNKLEEKNKKLYNNEKDYDTFKNLLITGGKFTSDEPNKNNIPEQIKKLENLEEIEENKNEEEKKENKENKENKEIIDDDKTKPKETKTIDTLYFGENYTFEDLNYDKIDFFVYEKDSIKRLLELDRRLHKIDPIRYNTSINTELKKIQDEFNKGKKERYEKTKKTFRENFYKFLKDSKETKKSIFDIPVKDESKIKYKDYLKEFQEQKNYKKDLENRLNQLDVKIKDIYKKDITNSQMKDLQKEIENYRKTEEYKKKFEEIKVPGLDQLNSLNNDIKEFDKKNQEISESLKELRNQLEIEKQKQINKEDEEKFKKEIIEPFIEHQKEIDNIDKDNKVMNEKINKLEEENIKEENMLIEIQKQLDEINANKDKYEKMFEEADKIMEMREEENKKNNIEDYKNDIFEDAEEIIKKYGINDLIEEQKKNEEVINYYENNLKIAENSLNNLKKMNEENDELVNKEFMSPEDFCKIPDEVKAYFEEKKREEEKKRKKIEEKKNENNENKEKNENNENNEKKENNEENQNNEKKENNEENKTDDLKINNTDIKIENNEDNKKDNNKIEDEKNQDNINNISKDSLEEN